MLACVEHLGAKIAGEEHLRLSSARPSSLAAKPLTPIQSAFDLSIMLTTLECRHLQFATIFAIDAWLFVRELIEN